MVKPTVSRLPGLSVRWASHPNCQRKLLRRRIVDGRCRRVYAQMAPCRKAAARLATRPMAPSATSGPLGSRTSNTTDPPAMLERPRSCTAPTARSPTSSRSPPRPPRQRTTRRARLPAQVRQIVVTMPVTASRKAARREPHRHDPAAPQRRDRAGWTAAHARNGPGMTDVSVADALDEHFGFAGAVRLLFATASLHADTLHALLTPPNRRRLRRHDDDPAPCPPDSLRARPFVRTRARWSSPKA